MHTCSYLPFLSLFPVCALLIFCQVLPLLPHFLFSSLLPFFLFFSRLFFLLSVLLQARALAKSYCLVTPPVPRTVGEFGQALSRTPDYQGISLPALLLKNMCGAVQPLPQPEEEEEETQEEEHVPRKRQKKK